MIILCDTKDKQNSHILDEFDNQKIEHKPKALKTGDYSFMIKACPELGFQYDTYFTDELCIERKNSLSELAGNLAQKSDDNRIFKELNRMINIERVYLVIENDCLDDIRQCWDVEADSEEDAWNFAERNGRLQYQSVYREPTDEDSKGYVVN